MKFGISNEGKNLAYEIIFGKKDITRRDKPYKIGSIHPIFMLHKGKKERWFLVGYVKIKSCIEDLIWDEQTINLKNRTELIKKETEREGYKKWENLWKDLGKFYGCRLPVLYRISFELSSYKEFLIKHRTINIKKLIKTIEVDNMENDIEEVNKEVEKDERETKEKLKSNLDNIIKEDRKLLDRLHL